MTAFTFRLLLFGGTHILNDGLVATYDMGQWTNTLWLYRVGCTASIAGRVTSNVDIVVPWGEWLISGRTTEAAGGSISGIVPTYVRGALLTSLWWQQVGLKFVCGWHW